MPHGSRGGMAFSADELRVLRRALAHVLNPATPGTPVLPGWARNAWVEDVQDVLRLAESIDEAVHEGGRMRAFALADLSRYRAALPGSASGYLERLEEAVADGYLPDREDLTALRNLTALPCAPQERTRRLDLRSRCGALAAGGARTGLEPAPRQLAIAGSPLTAVPGHAEAAVAAVADVVGAVDTESPARVPDPARGPETARVPEPARAGDAGNVADFARPLRSLRQQSRPAAPAAGVHPHPLPTRRGGPIPMAAYDPAVRPAESGRDTASSAPVEGTSPVRTIPTPGDLWPRGVRSELGPAAEPEAELATGTG